MEVNLKRVPCYKLALQHASSESKFQILKFNRPSLERNGKGIECISNPKKINIYLSRLNEKQIIKLLKKVNSSKCQQCVIFPGSKFKGKYYETETSYSYILPSHRALSCPSQPNAQMCTTFQISSITFQRI